MSTVQPDSEPPADALSPTVPRMILGNRLHRFREAAGVTPDRAGYEIRASRSKISRMENGRVGFKERDVADLLDLYGVTDEETRARLLALARQATAGGSFTVLRFGDADVPDIVYLEQLTSALYLDKREDVDHYLEVMNQLSAEALTPVETARFLAEIIRET